MYQNHQGKKKNIALFPETHKRLELFKADLIKDKQNPNLTYDEVINILLDRGRE
jgi:hypothetical protein